MNIPTSVFLNTPVSDYYQSKSYGSETMFQHMENILLDIVNDGDEFTLEQVAQNNVRYESPEHTRRAMRIAFEFEAADPFFHYCQSQGFKFGVIEEDDIEWDIVMVRLNEVMSNLNQEDIDIAIEELAYFQKKEREFKEYYMNMPFDLRKKEISEEVNRMKEKLNLLESFIK